MKKWLKKGFVAAACAATMVAGFGSANAADYNYIDLYESAALLTDFEYQSRTTSRLQPNRAMDITESGIAVGYLKGRFPDRTSSHVLTWDLNAGGTPTDHGVMESTSGGQAFAYGINESEQIAGTTRMRPAGTYTQYFQPYTYDTATSTLTNLVNAPTILSGVALDINNSGQTVGWASTSSGSVIERYVRTAFINNSADGAISYIPGAAVGTTSTDGSSANAINNAGLVTGYTTVDGNSLAFLYDSASEDFTTLGTLGGGLTSVGTDVNELGVVVGYATRADGVERAFLAYGGTMVDLGALGGEGTSQALGMNDKGDIVGTSNGHAFLYSNGQMIDLNDCVDLPEDMTLTAAYGINNQGQIVGYGFHLDEIDQYGWEWGGERAFALTPVTPTPVPASVLLFGSGLAGLVLVRRKAKG